MAAVAALLLSLPFFTRRHPAASRAEHDMEAVRAQLREVEQDRTRGVLTDAEAKNAEFELSRRLLAAAEAAERETGAAPAPRGLAKTFGAISAVGIPVIAFSVYAAIGSPTLRDQPLAARNSQPERPSQEQAETLALENGAVPIPEPLAEIEGMPKMSDLIGQLEARLAEKPDDRKGLELLARSAARIGQYGKSWRAFAKLVALDDNAPFHAEMAEAMVMAAGGYVSPEAEQAVDAALDHDASNPRAQHYKALALAQRGETRAALDLWVALLEDTSPDAPWRPMIEDRARQAAVEVGGDLPPSLAAPGPTAAQRAAAAEMTPEQRNEMIAGMVEGLASRLEDDPDDLEGWLRLIRAYKVMGREEDAQAALKTALKTFENAPDAIERLKSATQ